MNLLKSFISASMLMVIAACSKNAPEETVDSFPEGAYSGTMTVVYGGKENITNDVRVEVSYGEDGQADILFRDVKFVPQMPLTLTVTVPDVKCEQGEGGIILSGDGIVPLSGGLVPFPKFTVTSLSGRLSTGKLQLSLNFGEYPTSYSGVAFRD